MKNGKKFCHTPEGMAAKKEKKQVRAYQKAQRENEIHQRELLKNEERRMKKKEKRLAVA